jgi:hypothetical protein
LKKKSVEKSVENRIIYLTPMERKTKIRNKMRTHYVIATSIPDKWKDKMLKVTIEPAEAMAQDLALEGVRHWKKVEEQLDDELIRMRRLNYPSLR